MRIVIMYTIAAISILAIAALTGTSDYDVAKAEHANYCEMIETYRSTGGEYGWPDDGRDCSEVGHEY